VVDLNTTVVSATLRDAAGTAVENVEQDVPISIDVVIEAVRDLDSPSFVFHVRNDDGVVLFSFTKELGQPVRTGEQVRLRGAVENRLVPGRYYLDCWVRQDASHTMFSLQGLRLLGFVVYGTSAPDGVVTVGAEIEASVEP
jgi:hypothetical protein